MNRAAPELRLLQHEHTAWLRKMAAAEPAHHVFLSSLLEITGTAHVASPAGTLYGVFEGDRPFAAYWVGGTILSVGATPQTNALVAGMLNVRGRFACSIIGDYRPVLDLQRRLSWGSPRGVRADQPLLVADGAPELEPADSLRVGTIHDEPAAYAAAVEMFTEEVGFSPIENGAEGYRGKVRSNLLHGTTLLYTSRTGPDGGPIRRWPAPDAEEQVVFKADLGIRSRAGVQVQGVWVHPDFRGRGLAAPGMVAVTEHIRRTARLEASGDGDVGQPVVSLYVNSFNEPARRAYARAGFRQVGRFATVMY